MTVHSATLDQTEGGRPGHCLSVAVSASAFGRHQALAWLETDIAEGGPTVAPPGQIRVTASRSARDVLRDRRPLPTTKICNAESEHSLVSAVRLLR